VSGRQSILPTVVCLLHFAVPTAAQGPEKPFCNPSVFPATVFFVNGVITTKEKAEEAADDLELGLRAALDQRAFTPPVGQDCTLVWYSYNRSENFFRDVIQAAGQILSGEYVRVLRMWSGRELWPDNFQQTLIDAARNVDLATYVNEGVLAEHNSGYQRRIEEGAQVIVVGHSQGTLYANASFRSLTDSGVNVAPPIAVASPATCVEGGGPWTTLFEDAIATVIFAGLNSSRCPANTTNLPHSSCRNPFWDCHFFGKSYLGAVSGPKILNDILDAITFKHAPTAGFTMTSGPYQAFDGGMLNLATPPGGTVSVTLSAPVCSEGQAVGCSRAPGSAIATRTWTVDGTCTGSPEAQVCALGPGQHAISLRVTNAEGVQSQLATATIEVATLPTSADIRQISDTTWLPEIVGSTRVNAAGISPDGTRVAFHLESISGAGNGPGRLFLASTRGVAPVDVTPPGLGIIPYYPLRLSNTHVVFAACSLTVCGPGFGTEFANVYVMGVDGSGLVRLSNGGLVGTPVISGDGRVVAFHESERFPFAPTRLYFIRRADSGWSSAQEATIPGCDACLFSLNHDGSRMAYLTRDLSASGRPFHVEAIQTDGTNRRDLINVGEFGKDFDISGDGETVAVAFQGLATVFVSTGTRTNTVFTSDFGLYQPSLPFNGREIGFGWGQPGFPGEVFSIDTIGSNLRQLTAVQDSAGAFQITMSENGSAIVFLADADLDDGRNPDRSVEAFVALRQPSLAIDGLAASCRPSGETFQFRGVGFTPGGTVQGMLLQPDGSHVPLMLPTTDSQGRVQWSFEPTAATTQGRYVLWLVDEATGRASNPVYEIVGSRAGCSPVQ
jgi:hypothetical protein